MKTILIIETIALIALEAGVVLWGIYVVVDAIVHEIRFRLWVKRRGWERP